MWPVLTIADIENRWRLLTDAERAVAPQRIEDAEAMLRIALRARGVAAPPLTGDYDADQEWQTTYSGLVVRAVVRVLSNPDGVLEEREELDDYARTRRRDASSSTGALYFTDDEIASLIPQAGVRRTAFTIRLGQS